MWQDYFSLLQSVEGSRLFSPAPPLAVIIETEGMSGSGLAAAFGDFLGRAVEVGILTDAPVSRSLKQADAFRAVREGHNLSRVMPHMVNLDVSLDLGHKEDFKEDFVNDCRRALQDGFPNIRALFFGHAGDGNLHIVADHIAPGRDEATHEVHLIVYDPVRRVGGSISAENGIGMLRREYIEYSRNPAELAVMRGLKRALDPEDILNPGKLL